MNFATYWKNRRAMAWFSIISGLVVYPLACTLNKELSQIAMPFYTFVGAVLVGYQWTAALDDKWRNQQSKETAK